MLGGSFPPFCFFLFSLAPPWALPSFCSPCFHPSSSDLWSSVLPFIHHRRFFLVPWVPVLSPAWKKAREYLAPWSWNTLSQDKSVGRNSRHKRHAQRTKIAIYKVSFLIAGAHFPLYQRATAHSWKRFFHPQLHAWESPSAHSNEQWEQGSACRVD